MTRTRIVLVACMWPAIASAQVSDVEVPTLVIEQEPTAAAASTDEALDLGNIVESAVKGVTTVQEAPAIVTVVTADDIRDRQLHNLEELVDTVPGWTRVGILYSGFPEPLVRGQLQAVQFLHDGVSLFDPFINAASVSRVQPMELIKRVEMITGPGGVLWGANSLLGILNVITKDADDLEGVEIGGSIGHGIGDQQVARAYAMAGKRDLLGGKLKLFGHGSVETYRGPGFAMPLAVYQVSTPQPSAPAIYGPLTASSAARSMIVNLNGKLTFGKLQLRGSFPFGQMYQPLTWAGSPLRESLPDDFRCPEGMPDPTCADPMRTARTSRVDAFDRYGVAEARVANDKASLTTRAYLIEFVRNFAPLEPNAPSTLVQGGLAFNTSLNSYRSGIAFDGDVTPWRKFHVLYGAEAYREWNPSTTTTSRSGAGSQQTFVGPYDVSRLPILCPRIWDPDRMAIVAVPGCPNTTAFEATRSVLGAYLNPQLRPTKTLIFDAGARLQVAPASMGTLSYPLNTTYAGTVVWNFIPGWHLKLNLAQGFRPPVFNNTASNGEAVQVAGNPKLRVETSNAAQAEINARIFKGSRRIRELWFRVDGSYTLLEDLIQISSGSYRNSGDRELLSGEFLGKLYVQGGHRIELGYTWLRADTSDRGRLRSLPEHWFNLGTVFDVIANKVTATTNLKVSGAAEDPNRLVEYRGMTYDGIGNPQTTTVAATDLVMDRLPPIAELSAGLVWTPTTKLTLHAAVYNLLGGHHYQPDVFFDYQPHLEFVPNPYEGFRAYLSAYYRY